MAKARQVEFLISGIIDNTNGQPLENGTVDTFETGTTTARATFTDADKVSTASNPITLDSQGRATIFADGKYTFVFKDKDAVPQFTLNGLDFGITDETTINRSVKVVNANATLDVNDDLILVNASVATVTITLPTAINLEKEFIIKKTDSSTNPVILDGNVAETIDGAATFTIERENESAIIRSDSANWQLLKTEAADSALLGGLNSGQFLRSDVADNASGDITWDNNKGISGKETGGTARDLIKISLSDVIEVGAPEIALDINTSGSTALTHNGNIIWDKNNDGAGSGLDADLLDGLNAGNASGDIPISNTTVNTGLDADKVDGLHASVFLRSDEADQADGIIDFAANPTLQNTIQLIGREVDNSLRNMVSMSALDKIHIGDVNNPLRLQGTVLEFARSGDVNAVAHERDERFVQAWAKITTQATVTEGINISGVTRNAAGDYTATVGVTMANANFGIAGTADDLFFSTNPATAQSTTVFRYSTQNSSGTPVDGAAGTHHRIAVFGDRA